MWMHTRWRGIGCRIGLQFAFGVGMSRAKGIKMAVACFCKFS